MLSDFVEILERVVETLQDSGHATQSGPLELFALEERLRILDEAYVVTTDRFDQMLRGRELTKGDAEVVGIVKGMEEVLVKGVNLVDAWEGLEDASDLLGEGLLCELDLPRVKCSYT